MSPQRSTLGVLQQQQSKSQAEGEDLDDLLSDLDLNEADRAALHAKLELLRASDESGVSL